MATKKGHFCSRNLHTWQQKKDILVQFRNLPTCMATKKDIFVFFINLPTWMATKKDNFVQFRNLPTWQPKKGIFLSYLEISLQNYTE